MMIKDLKKNKFLIAIIIVVAFIYFFDNELYNELKTAVISNSNEEKIEIQSDKIIEDELLSPLRVYFLDVGQADSVLIEFNNEYMLIDAGNNEDGEKLVKYFKSLGIKKFKYLVGTHAHEDHIGGMDDIINNFDSEIFYMPEVVTSTKTFEDVLDALDKNSMYFDTPKIGESFILGDSSVEVIYLSKDDSNLNNSSIVLRLVYNDVSFLFTGDAEVAVEKEILNSNVKINSTVLKAGHHGSSTSNSSAFLKKVNPSYVVISSGKENSYGHPHKEVINRLSKNNIKIYRTDNLGTIIASSNGKHISFTSAITDTDGE